MIRQRVSLRTPPWGLLTRALTVVGLVALGYGGVLTALLALKVDPSQIESISDYRLIYDNAASLRADDFTTGVSLIAGFGGLLVFLFFAFLTLQALPRPYLTRSRVDLPDDERGATIVRPRAVERVAEHAGENDRRVVDVRARLGDSALHLDVTLNRPDDIPDALAGVRRRVREQLQRHELPTMPVNVTLTDYDRPTEGNTP